MEMSEYMLENFFCQICGKENQRDNKAKSLLISGKTFLGKEICCFCGIDIKMNNILNRIEYLKSRIKGRIRQFYIYKYYEYSVMDIRNTINSIYYLSKQIHNFRTFFKI